MTERRRTAVEGSLAERVSAAHERKPEQNRAEITFRAQTVASSVASGAGVATVADLQNVMDGAASRLSMLAELCSLADINSSVSDLSGMGFMLGDIAASLRPSAVQVRS
jgi:hypothetical protein